jgi:hypothetical protein
MPVFAFLPDFCLQVSTFWLLNIALTLQMITSCVQSNLWLSRQPEPARSSSLVYLTQLQAIWASQQCVNMLLIPMLTLRKFNGQAHACTHMLRTSLTRIACYVRNWSVLRSLRVQAFAMLSLLWYAPLQFTMTCSDRDDVMPSFQVHRKLYLQTLRLFESLLAY